MASTFVVDPAFSSLTSGDGQAPTPTQMVGFFPTTLPNGDVSIITRSVASSGVSISTAPPGTTSVVTLTNQPSPTQTQETQNPQTSPNLKVLLPAIVAPVVFVLLLASILLFTCLHYRNKKRERLDSGEHGMPVETQPLNKKPSNSFLLPSPLADADRTHEGSLGVYEKRKSLGEDAAKRNAEIIGMYERPSANAYNYDGEKYTNPRMPIPAAAVGRTPPQQNRSPSQGRTPPQSRPPPNNRAPPGSRTSPRSRSPLPPAVPTQRSLKPKPSPSARTTTVTDTTETTDSSWPLPASGPLPSPNSMHSSKTSLSARQTPKSSNFQLPPVTTSEPFSMREALRPESDTYDLSTSAATTIPKVPPFPDAHQPYDRTSRKRESDAISELSDRDRSGDHGEADRLSVVSAISGR